MTHRCDRCRATYESGAFYNGHDYCMTCYNSIKQEAERKLRLEQQKAQRMAEEKRRYAQDSYMRDRAEEMRKQHEELRRRELAKEKDRVKELMERKKEEMRLRWGTQDANRRHESIQGMYSAQAKSRVSVEEELKKRMAWDTMGKAVSSEGGAVPLGKQKRKVAARVYRDEPDTGYSPMNAPEEFRIEEKGAQKKDDEAASVELSVKAGLPVSLSIGQKGVKVALVGRNQSMKSINAEVFVSVFDSKKKPIEPKVEPKKFRLDAQGEKDVAAEFDLKEETEKGPLSFEAYIREDAFYINEVAGRSDPVLLHSQVKTPMDMQYKAGSAKVSQEEAGLFLCLTFDNKGESGGLLSKKSKAMKYMDDTREEYPLAAETKVKGMEKNVILKFAAEANEVPEKFVILLVGVDSNGKPYEKKMEIKKKEGRSKAGEKEESNNAEGKSKGGKIKESKGKEK